MKKLEDDVLKDTYKPRKITKKDIHEAAKELELETEMKRLERETKKAKKSIVGYSVDNAGSDWDKLVDDNCLHIPPPFDTGRPSKLKSLLHKALTISAIIISLGLMVAGVKVILQSADQTGVAILVTILLGYTIAINVKRFIK